MIQSDLGKFHATVCVSPNPEPVVATCFFFLYTVITAYVILSLFISVISAAMFEVIEMKKRQKSAELQLTQVSRQSRDDDGGVAMARKDGVVS